MTAVVVAPAEHVDGEVEVPGDKSISHRALILGAVGEGSSRVTNLSPAADVRSTLECLRRCGVGIDEDGSGSVELAGIGAGLRSPDEPLDCGNSGTTMRLLSGVLAGRDVTAVLDGDDSLRRRPMERVAVPLRTMGAEVETTGGRPPLIVRGRASLRGGEHVMSVPSAQVKSAILLAGLTADGPTTVVEPVPTRDHTERLLRLCGTEVTTSGSRVTMMPGKPRSFELCVPGDLSSAAFFLGLAAARPGWRVRASVAGLNPGRTGILDVLRSMGAGVEVTPTGTSGASEVGEPVGGVEVHGAPLHAVSVRGPMVARCIDELPLIAVVATQAVGITVIRDAAELRVKESDRIEAVAAGLRALGASCDVFRDGMAIHGRARLSAAELDSCGDHRLAMAWAIAATLADPASGPSRIDGADAVAISYPEFFDQLARLVRRVAG